MIFNDFLGFDIQKLVTYFFEIQYKNLARKYFIAKIQNNFAS